MSTVLVTGAAGFIGSHTTVDLMTAGYDVLGVDNFANSSPGAVRRIEKLAEGTGTFTFVELDLRDRSGLTDLLRRHPVDAVIHFAAKKAVGESVEFPFDYYDTNVGGTLSLLAAMLDRGVNRLVFSSSCSIYGDATTVPIREDAPARPTNPYARTKWMCEQILADVCRRHADWHVTSLRYFNPAGAHPSGLLGEDPRGIPNNVLPYLAQVAVGRRSELSIFGNDYPTPDGTGVRDYLHVVDLAEGHRLALGALDDAPGHRVINLGTGRGTSVRALLDAFSTACGKPLASRIVARRSGDVAELVADPALAADLLGWTASRDVAAMCRDAWEFQRLNPNGYETGPFDDHRTTSQYAINGIGGSR